MSWGVLGEPVAEHLDPPDECFDCDDDECPTCDADRVIENYLDEMKDEGEL